ncbi:Carbohydrate-binding protein, partial [Globisporangium splendens]
MRVYPRIWSAACAAAIWSLVAHVTVAQQMFDVVVIGSGPGGLVAAEYLSRDPSVSVLILEAGLPSLQATGGTDSPDYAKSRGWTKFDIPGEYDVTIYNPENEKYRVDWITGPYMWLGKLVGGCSSINAQLYFRTPDSIVAKAFRNNGYSEKTINDAAARNAKHETFGHAPFTVRNGLRDSPANSFWNKMKTRPNVQLRTQAMVSHIKQSQGKAMGVVYNTNVEVALTTRGAVIMAAGALGTPKVLIQSGIGSSNQLDLLNARSDFPGVKQSNGRWVINPNVGQNLFDTNVVFATFTHPDMKPFQYKTRPSWAIDQYLNHGQTGGWASFGPTLIGYENYAVNGRMYEFQTTVLTNGFTDYYSLPNAFTTSFSAHFGTANDLAAMQPYATKVVDMMKANAVCADAKLRVLDTNNIFVADASAMRDGTVNPYGFIMYIGREAAGQVKEFVASGPAPPQPATCGIENGVDYIGNDIGSAASATAVRSANRGEAAMRSAGAIPMVAPAGSRAARERRQQSLVCAQPLPTARQHQHRRQRHRLAPQLKKTSTTLLDSTSRVHRVLPPRAAARSVKPGQAVACTRGPTIIKARAGLRRAGAARRKR